MSFSMESLAQTASWFYNQAQWISEASGNGFTSVVETVKAPVLFGGRAFEAITSGNTPFWLLSSMALLGTGYAAYAIAKRVFQLQEALQQLEIVQHQEIHLLQESRLDAGIFEALPSEIIGKIVKFLDKRGAQALMCASKITQIDVVENLLNLEIFNPFNTVRKDIYKYVETLLNPESKNFREIVNVAPIKDLIDDDLLPINQSN